MSKTLGQIANEAWTAADATHDPDESWEIAASAVVDECLKITGHQIYHYGNQHSMAMAAGMDERAERFDHYNDAAVFIDEAIRRLKEKPADAQLKSPEGDERSQPDETPA
jgi:hypothetical protein